MHVPWCVQKCPYCDFNSHALQGGIPEEQYLKALEADLIHHLPHIWGRAVQTVFIGGGTPSLLSAQAMDRLLAMLRNLLGLAPTIEITMEANPGTVEADKFKEFAASGINRLSLGIQSFNDQHLKVLGRIHSADEAKSAIDIAQRYFQRINLDLMFALPGQTLKLHEQDLKQALSYETEHLSLYNLTLEPNTVYAKYPPSGLPDDDLVDEMLEQNIAFTAAAGFEHYEVSAYARPNAYARHNINYWQFGDYLGIGPGAHGKISFHDKIVRTVNQRSPDNWMDNALKGDGSHQVEWRELKSEDIPFEFMLNALRLQEGVPSSLFSEHTGLSPLLMQKQLKQAIDKGLLEDSPLVYKATELGWRFLNDLQAIFLD
ncbi:MAG: radical SAM family heme chaperone HemW [Alcaligenaceae bacterium]|nr:radical SAM family heme chaperone HemW [Alcaligenaceae bacterium]